MFGCVGGRGDHAVRMVVLVGERERRPGLVVWLWVNKSKVST